MKKLLFISNCIDNINQKAAIIARWSILIMLGLGLWNVVGRYLGVAIGYNLSSNKLIESQWYLFDLAFLLGLGWTHQRQNHVRVDVFQNRFTRKKRIIIELIGTLFLLLPYALSVGIISVEPAIHSWMIGENSPDPNGLPRYLVKTIIPIGFFLLTLQGLSEMIHNSIELRKENAINKLR